MATISGLTDSPAGQTTTATRHWKSTPRLSSVVIDFAEALALKGSALAASDVIPAIRFAAGSYIHFAGIQCVTPDNATTLTLDLGITGGDVDTWVDGFDQAAAAAGAYAVSIIPGTTAAENLKATAGTIDVLFATLTGTLSTGKIRVFALITDINGHVNAGLAQIGQ